MCKFKSAIILKNRVYVPDIDSHTEMLEQLGIEDNYINAKKIFVRAKLFPSDDDYFSDISNWEFNVDQDILPDWFDEEEARGRMIEAVKDWAKNRIYIGVNDLVLKDGANYILKDCKNVIIYGNSTVEYMSGNSTVKYMCGSSTVNNMCGNSTVKYMCDSSTVNNMCGNSTVEYMYDSSTVNNMCDSSIINIYSKSINAKEIKLDGNATVRDFITRTIYQSRDWKFVLKD